jgi:hypothetical protein
MIGNEISDQHAGHDADAAQAGQGESQSQTRCEGPSSAPCRTIHIPTVGSAAGVTSEYSYSSTHHAGTRLAAAFLPGGASPARTAAGNAAGFGVHEDKGARNGMVPPGAPLSAILRHSRYSRIWCVPLWSS